jgi:hypothetical protein
MELERDTGPVTSGHSESELMGLRAATLLPFHSSLGYEIADRKHKREFPKYAPRANGGPRLRIRGG